LTDFSGCRNGENRMFVIAVGVAHTVDLWEMLEYAHCSKRMFTTQANPHKPL